MEPESNGLLRAYVLDGQGSGKRADWAAVRRWTPDDGAIWIHLDAPHPDAVAWLRKDSGLDESTCDTLLAGPTRPQSHAAPNGMVVILRGVNLNPSADPEDMISLRLWVDGNRMISLSRRRLKAIEDLSEDIEKPGGPLDSADLMIDMAGHLLDRLAPTLDALSATIDDLEDKAGDVNPSEVQGTLADKRSAIIALRRYIAPQKSAISEISAMKLPIFEESHHGMLRVLVERLEYSVEELDELRDRTRVIQDLLAGRQAETMNARMFTLSIITAIFLPLGLLTGLLGINVGGMPGASDDRGFLIVCVLLGIVTIAEMVALRRMRWF
tara:strand:- start:3868 stop:4845 length:978 start_codon:yes stop_codon:yes gene_type:complete